MMRAVWRSIREILGSPRKPPDAAVATLKLSPLSRLYLTLDIEARLDPSWVADEKRYERFLVMFRLAEQRRDQLLRNFLLLDAIALLLLFGKTIQIPGLNIGLGDLPAAREVAIFLAAFAFNFTAAAFVNWNGYAAIIDTINAHRAKRTAIDPDFLSGADKFLEFTVKLYRSKMNIGGIDFAAPGRSYQVVSLIIMIVIGLVMLSLVFFHLTVVVVSLRQTLMSIEPGILNALLVYAYTAVVCAANLGGTLLFFTVNWSFKFTDYETIPRTTPHQ